MKKKNPFSECFKKVYSKWEKYKINMKIIKIYLNYGEFFFMKITS